MMGSKFLKKKKPPGLMLTSLLDMFTIILIFLIVSFEAEDYDFQLNPKLKLPESSARSVFKPAVNIAITPESLVIERKKVATLKDGRFPTSYYENDEVPEVIKALTPLAEAKRSKNEGIDPDKVPEEDQMIVLLQADQKIDYRTLFLVLKSTGKAGFVKYRLAIMKK